MINGSDILSTDVFIILQKNLNRKVLFLEKSQFVMMKNRAPPVYEGALFKPGEARKPRFYPIARFEQRC